MRIFIKDVAASVFSAMQEAFAFPDDSDVVDVRLVSSADRSEWVVNVGDPSYDQWHGAACGSEYFVRNNKPTKKAAETIARSLIDQVDGSLAQMEGK